MLAKPAEDLIYPNGPNPNLQFVIPNLENYMNKLFPWGTTVDGTDAGVPDIPKFLLEAGKFPKVPVIFGTNSNEFQSGCLGKAAFNVSSCSFINKIDYLMRTTIDLENNTDIRRTLSFIMADAGYQWLSDEDFEKIDAMYPAAQFRSGGDRLSQMLVDSNRWMGHCSTLHSAQLIRAHSPNVWVYHFDLPGNKLFTGGLTGHASEIPFVFGNCDELPLGLGCQGVIGNNSAGASGAFMNAWSSLARAGNPGQNWPRLEPNGTKIQMITAAGGAPVSNYRAEFCSLWESIDPFFSTSAGSKAYFIV